MAPIPRLPVYVKVKQGKAEIEIYTDPDGKQVWGTDVSREVDSGGVLQFFFIRDESRESPETADLYVIPQTVDDNRRRESPFWKPEDPVHFIEDPGWGAGAPTNPPPGKLPKFKEKPHLGAVYAGEVRLRTIPTGTELNSRLYKFAIFARGDRGRWVNGVDPTIIIRPD